MNENLVLQNRFQEIRPEKQYILEPSTFQIRTSKIGS